MNNNKTFQKIILIGACIVLLAGIAYLGDLGIKKYRTPDVNPVLVQQYNTMNAEFQYLDRSEKEMFNKMLTVAPAQLAPMQEEVKSIRAKKAELQNQFKKFVDEAKKASK